MSGKMEFMKMSGKMEWLWQSFTTNNHLSGVYLMEKSGKIGIYVSFTVFSIENESFNGILI